MGGVLTIGFFIFSLISLVLITIWIICYLSEKEVKIDLLGYLIPLQRILQACLCSIWALYVLSLMMDLLVGW